MFEQFSHGYYLGRMYVEPRAADRATMARAQHERVNEQLYATGEGVERTDYPLVMKLGTNHFPVHPEESVPADTLALPEDLLSDAPVRHPPTLAEVFLAKADRARQLLAVGGWLPGNDGPAGPGDAIGGGGPDGPAGI